MIDFPNAPVLDQVFTSGDKTWIWTGTAWRAYRSEPDVTLSGTQTLTNKTLTSPTITGTVEGNAAYSVISLDLNSSASLSSNTMTINVITPVKFDEWPYAGHRSAEYLVQLNQGPSYTLTKMLLVHDGVDVAISEYGYVSVGTAIDYVLSGNFAAGNLELSITCSTANVTPVALKFSRTLFDA